MEVLISLSSLSFHPPFLQEIQLSFGNAFYSASQPLFPPFSPPTHHLRSKAIQLSHLLASRLPYPSFFDRDTLLPMLPELLTRQVAAAKSHPGLGASLSRTASSLCTQQRLLEGHDSTYEPAPLLEESDFEPVFVDTGLWQLQLDILRGPSREEKESKDGGQDGIGGGGRSGGRPRQTRENTATVDPRVRQVFGVQRNLDRTAAAVAVWDVGLRFEGARRMLVEDEKVSWGMILCWCEAYFT